MQESRRRNINFNRISLCEPFCNMEQVNQNTPGKVHKCDGPLINNPWLHRTPIKQNETHALKRSMYRSKAQCLPFNVLPTSHVTPPSRFDKFIVKNPFESDLINKLHLPVISPTVFTKVSTNIQQSPDFTWNIDELARIQPAKIEEFPKQQPCTPDLELEVKAQAAIDRFFTENQVIPSPWDIKKKENKSHILLDTPNRLLDDLNSTKELLTKDACCQTVLSLPLNLPQNVEEALRPFFTFTQKQNTDSDDINSSNNSLRRKLFFNLDEYIDNDTDSIMSLSPVKMSGSMILSCSPPQSGTFVHNTPLKTLLQSRRQSDEMSVSIFKNLSPPNISPIYNIKNERIGHCSHSATRLDLAMDMSIDNVSVEKNIFLDESDARYIKRTNNKSTIANKDKVNIYDSIDTKKIAKYKRSVDNTVHLDAIVLDDKEYNDTTLKIATKVESFLYETHKQNNVISNPFDQQSTSNSI